MDPSKKNSEEAISQSSNSPVRSSANSSFLTTSSPELPRGTRTFKSSRASLKVPQSPKTGTTLTPTSTTSTSQAASPSISTTSNSSTNNSTDNAHYPSAYRRRLIEKKVAIMPDGKFSFEVEEEGADASSGRPRRHPLCQGGVGLISSYHPEIKTLRQSFQMSVARNRNNPFLGTRERLTDGSFGGYQWKSFGEVSDLVDSLVGGMSTLNLKPKASVGLFSINREEWIVTEHACFANSLITVPLYDTLGDEAIAFICNQTEMEIVFTSRDKLKLLKGMMNKLPGIKYIVSFDALKPEDKDGIDEAQVQLLEYAQLMKTVPKEGFIPEDPLPSDLCSICYTSGTTGMPKGVIFLHSALLADASACLALCGYGPNGFTPDQRSLFELKADDVHISYLPLAHIFERVVMTALTTVGAGIGFYQGNTLKILEDVAALRPTVFVSVPRLLSKVYDKVMAGVKEKSAIKQFLFNWAYSAKRDILHSEGVLTHWLYDRFVFAEIREKFGGRLRAILSGSAPIAPEVMDFLRICFSCEVYEGYGSTETAAATCLTIRHDWTTGHVGIPTPCNEVKLVDVPEMNYFANDPTAPRGEICVRGPNCFTGYFCDPEKTAETLDEKGWVHSGDIGEWDGRGRLRIIDRKKNIFKLSQGEFVAPERIEAVLTKSLLIGQCYLYGDSLESACLAVIVPDREELSKWIRRKLAASAAAEEEGSTTGGESSTSAHASRPSSPNPEILAGTIKTGSVLSRLASLSWEELCQDEAVYGLITAEIAKFGSRGGSGELKGFEVPKAIHLESEPFSLENGLLTATFKLKRNEAKVKYLSIFNRMYRELKAK